MEDKIKNNSIIKLIFKMSIPSVISMLISALYNIVDSIFVAQLGEEALRAVSIAFPIQTLIIAVSVGTGVGVSTLIARKIGERDLDYASEVANYSITLGAIIGLFFAFVALFLVEPFFALFTDNPVVLEGGITYTKIVTFFSFAMAIILIIEKTMQGTGNMIHPMYIVFTGAIINLILDPILIFGLLGAPALGIKGAAIATVTGQIIAMIFAIILLYKSKRHNLKMKAPVLKLKAEIIRNIMSVGLPAILMQALASFLVLILNGLVSGYSESAVSVLGIYFRLIQFVFMPVYGITQGIRPIQAYFYGAGNEDKLKDTFKKSNILTSILMLTGTLVFFVFSPLIMKAFNPTDEMYVMGIQSLRIISTCFIFAGVNIMYSTLFQAIGEGKLSFMVSFLRELIIIVPLALLFGKFFGLTGIWVTFTITEFLTVIITHYWLGNRAEKTIQNRMLVMKSL